MTLSSTEPRALACTSAVFHPPSSTSSSSSVSSPLPDLLSAMEVKGGCEDEVPICRPEKWAEDDRMSGVRIESESDSVPETGATDTWEGYSRDKFKTLSTHLGKCEEGALPCWCS